ncbi:MAG: hypothetical protein NTV01_18520 [Bacteroidia bacterium]|nr:hypothetical protein [Bacteroidia bacterium]
MKSNLLNIVLLAAVFASCKPAQTPTGKVNETAAVYDSTDRTNDFYDNQPVVNLPGSKVIEVSGEVSEPQSVILSNLPERSLIVKETRIESGEIEFTGAYRYDGVSLYDILNQVKVVKKNAKEFNPIIDQYVVVYNAAGDSVVFSWGEIYYPVQFHQIIIANQVVRIVPTKSKDKWPLPEKARIIAGSDLITERNIADPVRIVIRSLNVNYKVDRSIKLWAPEMAVEGVGKQSFSIKELPDSLIEHQFEHVFYGRGMGIHGITLTKGAFLKDLFAESLKPDRNLIRNGFLAIAGIDGYRCSVTYSELMNRNDNAEVIIRDRGMNEDGGRFSCLFTADFFSDRAIKSISEIRLVQ